MDEKRTTAATYSTRRRRASRAVIAGYIHELSQRHETARRGAQQRAKPAPQATGGD